MIGIDKLNHRKVRTLLGVSGVLSLALVGAGIAWSEPAVPPREPPKKLSADEYRKLFPIVSVAPRLEYEAKRLREDDVAPDLTPEARKRLEQVEKTGGGRGGLRVLALQTLHSKEAEAFVKSGGFGFERMRRSAGDYFYLPEAPTILQGTVSYDESTLAGDPAATLPAKGAGTAGPLGLPSLESLLSLHDLGGRSFLSPDSFGYVKDRNQVVGFEPHHFRFDPAKAVLNREKPKEDKDRWVMRQLQLVSLLKFDEPRVYVSPDLPRMKDLADTPVRVLSTFETKALKQLQRGEDLVTDASVNCIHMLGSLRATTQCLRCHHGKRGELLGAFTYELLRDPPLRNP
jgi:hypothetical protein